MAEPVEDVIEIDDPALVDLIHRLAGVLNLSPEDAVAHVAKQELQRLRSAENGD